MDPYNLKLMNLIDEQYLKTPFYGFRKMTVYLRKLGHWVNEKRVRRLMKIMGLIAIYPKPNLSKRNQEHKVYPYLLRNVEITHSNQVFSTDITYIRMKNGFMYLTAVMDWYSRKILSWELSNTLDTQFCIDALNNAIRIYGCPEIFNTDQGCQYTSTKFTDILKENDIKISMDSKGRALDNIFVERVWRSVKYECIFLNNYETVPELYWGLKRYIDFYNSERPHQSLEYGTPNEQYIQGLKQVTEKAA